MKKTHFLLLFLLITNWSSSIAVPLLADNNPVQTTPLATEVAEQIQYWTKRGYRLMTYHIETLAQQESKSYAYTFSAHRKYEIIAIAESAQITMQISVEKENKEVQQFSNLSNQNKVKMTLDKEMNGQYKVKIQNMKSQPLEQKPKMVLLIMEK